MRCSRRIYCLSLMLMVLFSNGASLFANEVPVTNQGSGDLRVLELGKPIERELAGDQAHSYRIALTAGQYLHVVVEQKGIDVVVTLFGSDGKKLVDVDSPNGTQGPEPVSIIAETTGGYRLEVRSLEKTAAAGRYEVKIEELREATGQDKSRIAAERAFAQATLLMAQGTAESLRNAIKKYEESLPLYHAVRDRSHEAVAFNSIGFIYSSLGEKQKALEYFTQALPIWKAVGDRRGEASTLVNIGSVYDDLGEKKKALEFYTQALPLFRAVGGRSGEASTLNNIGNVYNSLGEPQKALEFYNQSMSLNRAVGDRSGEASTLGNIGNVYNSLGELQKALEFYNQSLPLKRAVGDHRGEANTLNNIGNVYADLGESQKALEFYNQSLPLFRAVGGRRGEASTLMNIGNVYNSLGEKQKALGFYNQALPLFRAVGDRSGEANTLGNVGNVYNDLGELRKALEFYNQSLPLFRAVGDRRGEANALNNSGNVYADLGEGQKALGFYNQSLLLKRASGDRSGEANTLNNIGTVYADLGEKPKALEIYNQSLPLSRAVGNRGWEANTLMNMGEVYASLGEKQKAHDYYTQALQLFRAVGNRSGEAATLHKVARLKSVGGKLTESLANIEAALTIVESLRTKIGSQELRSSYFASVQKYYELYTDVLMRMHKQKPSGGYDGKALQASERGRARSLLETLAEANADIRQGVDAKLLERERGLQQRLNAKAQKQTKFLSRPHKEEQAQTIAKEIEALTTELQQVEAEIRQKSPSYAALTQPQPLALKEIQTKVLDRDMLLLEYSLGTEHSYLWAVTPTSIRSYELPKRDEIEKQARTVYGLLSARQPTPGVTEAQQRAREAEIHAQYQTEATALSRMLLGPVTAQLGRKRLLIVADGALQYIPFGALPAPANLESRVASRKPRTGNRTDSRLEAANSGLPLIVEHEIISLPSASTLAVLRQEVKDRKPAEKAVAVLADPVFEDNDERVARIIKGTPADNPPPAQERELPLGMERSAAESGLRGRRLPRLPGTREEGNQILSLVTTAEGKGAFDFAASRLTAKSPELSQYRYVHFATHGFLNSLHPELSGIVLSMFDEKGAPQDGFLRAHEVFNLKLPAELVVLSACQTGLGKEVRGEGLVSLTRGFMYAGAPRVVVSLWNVNDQATAQLMAHFYRGVLKDKLRPAAALRAAQVSLMKERAWEAPFYWAAFTIQGEWR